MSQGRLVLGKHSGRHAFRQRLIELGYNLGDADAEKAYERFISLCDRKKTITDRDLEAIVDEQIVQVEEEFALEYLAVTTGSSMVPTATVRVRHGADVLQEAACGDGPLMP